MTDTQDNLTIDIEEAIEIETAAMGEAQILQHNNALEVQQIYGDNLPYQRDRVINEAQFFIDQTGKSMLEVGKRLILIKENETVKDFTEIVDTKFNIGKSTAYNLMQATAKFLSLDTKSFQALGNLGMTKLLDLANQDIEELEALAEGGTVAGLKLDEMDKMTTRELKEALKKARKDLKEVQEDNAAVREVSRKKDEKISKLDEELAKKDQADAKKKRLELEELDSVTVLVNDYTDQYKEVITKLASAIYQLEQIRVEAEKEMLPPRFFKEMALASSHEMERIQSLLEQLPDDTAPLDVSWLPQNKEGEEPLFNNGPLSE